MNFYFKKQVTNIPKAKVISFASWNNSLQSLSDIQSFESPKKEFSVS